MKKVLIEPVHLKHAGDNWSPFPNDQFVTKKTGCDVLRFRDAKTMPSSHTQKAPRVKVLFII